MAVLETASREGEMVGRSTSDFIEVLPRAKYALASRDAAGMDDGMSVDLQAV